LIISGAFGLGWPATNVDAQTIVTFPYPKWFFSPEDSSPDKLMFRMYANEGGVARNLFVLTCDREPRFSVWLEVIPPKGLEERLRRTASATLSPTSIAIYHGRRASKNGLLFETSAEYDKIAAFVDLGSERRLQEFLQLFDRDQLFVRWDRARIEYALLRNRLSIEQFTKNFGPVLRERRVQELPHQEVFLRCSKLWE
jgi:hypothetical protein